MNKFLVLCSAILMSCTTTPSTKTSLMQKSAEILVSESQGGMDKLGFTVIKNEQEFRKAIKGNFGLVELGKEPAVNYPKFPKDKKVILYNLGTFRSGDHRITQIKSISIKNNVLFIEVPYYESGGMEIQMISSPWLIFTVPADNQFTSIELKYSK